jgi:hypothetical protein
MKMIKTDNNKSKHLSSQNSKYQQRKGKSSQPKERLKTPSSNSGNVNIELCKNPQKREKHQLSSSGSSSIGGDMSRKSCGFTCRA